VVGNGTNWVLNGEEKMCLEKKTSATLANFVEYTR